MNADFQDTIIRRLEEAGRTLMMLPQPVNSVPKAPRSAWPEIAQMYEDIMAIKGEQETGEEAEARRQEQARAVNRVRLTPTSAAITELDETLGLYWLIPDPAHSRVVFGRSLIWPASERHVYSWRGLARTFHTSPRTARRWFKAGVQSILEGLAENS